MTNNTTYLPFKLQPTPEVRIGSDPHATGLKAKRTDILMTAHDIHLTDLVKTANILDKAPTAPSSNDKIKEQRPRLYRNRVKRMMDVALILMAVPIVLPIVAVLALLIALDGGKPFYSQRRVGKNGTTYRIWKLRSMVLNADAVLEQHLASDPSIRAEWDSKQKLLDDPRITRLGQVLRKCSVDELPQLWNVLRGDMSLVGPRPMMVNQKDMYPGHDYYELRPGITGLWQISDRNGTTFADRARYDANYNERLSFKTDFMILLGTVRVVLRGTGH